MQARMVKQAAVDWDGYEAPQNYEAQLESLVQQIDNVIEYYLKEFDRLAAIFNDQESDLMDARELNNTIIDQLEACKARALKPKVKFNALVREFDYLLVDLSEQWDELTQELDLIMQSRREAAARFALWEQERLHEEAVLSEYETRCEEELKQEEALQQKTLKQEEELVASLTQAVTFTPDEGARSQALDAANPAKFASMQHRLTKAAVIDGYRAKYPDETAPMYQKQRFFKQKEERPSRAHWRNQLVNEEVQADLLAEQDCDNEAMAQWEEELAARLEALRALTF